MLELPEQIRLCEEFLQIIRAFQHIWAQPLDCHCLSEAQQRIHQLRLMHICKATLTQQIACIDQCQPKASSDHGSG